MSVRRIAMDSGGAGALAPTLRAAGVDGPAEDVAAALADVRARGDAAVVDSIRRFDAPGFAGTSPVVDPEEVRAAADALEPSLREAIAFAADQVRQVAEASRP
ncbi:MAG: histidinol dehydrogenase, partial [Deltaproteobacteria bacterium]|nr:histidinol dehydrogenase [Deltaproteobacteria bacterium]